MTHWYVLLYLLYTIVFNKVSFLNLLFTSVQHILFFNFLHTIVFSVLVIHLSFICVILIFRHQPAQHRMNNNRRAK